MLGSTWVRRTGSRGGDIACGMSASACLWTLGQPMPTRRASCCGCYLRQDASLSGIGCGVTDAARSNRSAERYASPAGKEQCSSRRRLAATHGIRMASSDQRTSWAWPATLPSVKFRDFGHGNPWRRRHRAVAPPRPIAAGSSGPSREHPRGVFGCRNRSAAIGTGAAPIY